MSLLRLWWAGVVWPRRAFAELLTRPAPQWGWKVVLACNLAILPTTLPAVRGMGPLMPSALTFLPAEKYLLAQVFFLPPLRVLMWLLAAAVIHLGLRLARHPGGYDQILNIGGLVNLVVMPCILVSDWLLTAAGHYALVTYTHPLSILWSAPLTAIGLKQVLGVKSALAWGLTILSLLVTIPFLALLAR